MTLPKRRPLITFLGDDFTGSSAVMELLSFAGLPTVLFLDLPDIDQLARFADYAGIGLATVARSKNPAWMDRHLPEAFQLLATLEAPISHYKVCSTFDSAPHVGSIGRAIDLAVPILGGNWHPLLVAAPVIGRYQLFGNLFAVTGGEGYRLDRHPTMAHHPITPMHEADLRRHLGEQTDRKIGLIDYIKLTRGEVSIGETDEIIAIDVIDEASLLEAGRLIWERRGERLLAIGSQGIEYALLAWWRKAGLLGDPPPRRQGRVMQTAAVSGSCSPLSATQIEWAVANGFDAVALDASKAVTPDQWRHDLDRVTGVVGQTLANGRNALVYTATGPGDPAIGRVREAASNAGLEMDEVNTRIGSGLGLILKSLVETSGIRRVCIAGGDTSGHALTNLGIRAIEASIELAPACAINIGHSYDPALDGIEVAVKGGQMGPENYFGLVAAGGQSS